MTTGNRPIPGDHLVFHRFLHAHHAIYVGHGLVIEYGGKTSAQRPSVRLAPLRAVMGGSRVSVRRYPAGAALPGGEVVRRGLARLGEKRYDLWGNNCEHFAAWCKTGRAASEQAESVGEAVGAGLGVIVAMALRRAT